jgi:hypothetical protein
VRSVIIHPPYCHQAVAQRAGDHDAVEAGVLVGGHVVVGHTALAPEILRVRPGMDGADRHHETHAVSGSDLAAAQLLMLPSSARIGFVLPKMERSFFLCPIHNSFIERSGT